MVLKFRFLTALVFGLLITSSAFAQDVGVGDSGLDAGADLSPSLFTLSGNVKLDGRSGGFAASVTLLGTFSQTVVTNNNGDFEFNELPTGDYELTVSFPDFVSSTQNLSLDQNRFVDVTLFRDLVATFRVTVNFEGDSAELSILSERGDTASADVGMISDASSSPIVSFVETVRNGQTQEVTVPVSTWIVGVTADGFLPFERTIVMNSEPGQIYVIDVDLAPTLQPDASSKTECTCRTVNAKVPFAWFGLLGLLVVLRRRRQ